jgi:hypothetical protein
MLPDSVKSGAATGSASGADNKDSASKRLGDSSVAAAATESPYVPCTRSCFSVLFRV